MSNNEDNGWNEYQKLILSELKRLNTLYDKLCEEIKDMGKDYDSKLDRMSRDKDEKIVELKVEISALKVKSGLWGSLAGLVSALAVLLLRMI